MIETRPSAHHSPLGLLSGQLPSATPAKRCLVWETMSARLPERLGLLAEGSGTNNSKNGSNILTRRVGVEFNCGTCQTRHGIKDVMTILLDRCVDVVGEVRVLIREPGLGDLAGCGQCSLPVSLSHRIPPVIGRSEV